MKTYKKMVKRKNIEYQGENCHVDQKDWRELEEGFLACGMKQEAITLRNSKSYPIMIISH